MNELSYNKVVDLTTIEKTDLALMSGHPSTETLFKFMEMVVLTARDAAMAVDPVDETLMLSKMRTANAMAQFYWIVKEKIKGAASERLGEIQAQVAHEAMKEQAVIEEIIFSQTTGIES